MRVIQIIIIIPCLPVFGEFKMQPFIVDGEAARIVDFPYMAHLGTECIDEKKYKISWICGSSIINQNIILTAGHCVHGCWENTNIAISVGHEYKSENGVTTAYSFLIHENYDDETLNNDIALVRIKTPLVFNATIKRVALMKAPPYNEEALVAGWGLTDEKMRKTSLILMFTQQHILKKEDCLNLFEWMTEGTFCARNLKAKGFTAQGDSGSPLVVQGYIQLGIVSSKVPEVSDNVAVYTDIGYFYDWIQKNVKKIMCVD